MVSFCNNISTPIDHNNVYYYNKNDIDKSVIYDLAIAISDCNQFDYVEAKKKLFFL